MRYLEDFAVGDVIGIGPYRVSEADILEFGNRYDPQVFHTDSGHPRSQALGGLLASGWHTGAICMRMAVDAYMNDTALLTSPGIDRLRWLVPVRPGDVLSGSVTVESVRPSQSKPDRGVMVTDVVIQNASGVTVMTLQTTSFVMVRPALNEQR